MPSPGARPLPRPAASSGQDEPTSGVGYPLLQVLRLGAGCPPKRVVMRARTPTHETVGQGGVLGGDIGREVGDGLASGANARAPENDRRDDARASAPPLGTPGSIRGEVLIRPQVAGPASRAVVVGLVGSTTTASGRPEVAAGGANSAHAADAVGSAWRHQGIAHFTGDPGCACASASIVSYPSARCIPRARNTMHLPMT